MLGALLVGGGAVLGAFGKRKAAKAEKEALKEEAANAESNAQTAEEYAEYELQAWESVADNNENIRRLQASFSETLLNKDVLVSDSLAQARANFSLAAVSAEEKLSNVILDRKRREAHTKLGEDAMLTGVKAGLKIGAARAAMAASGVSIDDGSAAEVISSVGFARDVDYADIIGRANIIQQTFTEETVQSKQKSTLAGGEIDLNYRSQSAARNFSLESKKQEITFNKDLELFLAREQLKNEALKRAWGYRNEAKNQRSKAASKRKSAKGISPNLEFASSLLSGGAATYSAYKK